MSVPNVCTRKHLTEERTRYVEQLLERERGELSDLERQVVESLAREETVARDVEAAWAGKRTFGERVSDFVADFGGSWKLGGAPFRFVIGLKNVNRADSHPNRPATEEVPLLGRVDDRLLGRRSIPRTP
jgi:hypothetical protein